MSVINYLRDATVQALENEKWDDARSLFTMLENALTQERPPAPVLTLVSTGSDIPKPKRPEKYRSEAEWTDILQNHFVPEMIEKGLLELSTTDVYLWVERRSDIELNEMEREQLSSSGEERWKNRIAAAISRLKMLNILAGKPKSRNFIIVVATQPTQLPLDAVVS